MIELKNKIVNPEECKLLELNEKVIKKYLG